MKRIAWMLAATTMFALSGCSGGIEFNGAAQVEQFPVRKIPVVHYVLPSEVAAQGGGYVVDENTMIALTSASFTEQGPAGFDLWTHMMQSAPCTDNPTCNTSAPIPDWVYMFQTGSVGNMGGVTGFKTSDTVMAYIMSFENQWFLRNLDSNPLPPPTAGQPPVTYEGRGFSSMPISFTEDANAVSPVSQTLGFTPPYASQQEIGDPATYDARSVPRVQTPVNNYIQFQYNGVGAPAGLLAAGWHEPPATNTHIETNRLQMTVVPVPDYFGSGSGITTGGGVYTKRFIDMWLQVTTGPSSTLQPGDTVIFCYYLATIASHIVGYGIGLVDSSFAVPGVVNNQDDIMNLAVVFDLSAMIAAGKQFQFVVEDLMRMQDIVNGTYAAPGPLSTLPGPGRP